MEDSNRTGIIAATGMDLLDELERSTPPISNLQKKTDVQEQPSIHESILVEDDDPDDSVHHSTLDNNQGRVKAPAGYESKLQAFKFDTDHSKTASERLKILDVNGRGPKLGVLIKPPKTKKSHVWKFFIKENGVGECRLCGMHVRAPGNTSNLARHISKKHGNSEINGLTRGLMQTRERQKRADESRVNPSIFGPNQSAVCVAGASPTKKQNTCDGVSVGSYNPNKFHQQPRIDKVIDRMNALQQLCSDILAPRFQLPKRKAITRVVEEKYQVLSTIVKSRFDKAKSITLTTDIWTETANTQGYLGVIAHVLENSSMTCIEVETIKLSTNRTAQYISKIVEDFLMEERLSLKLLKRHLASTNIWNVLLIS